MKILSNLLLILLFPVLVVAQVKKQHPILELADRHFNNCEFYLASHEYKRFLKNQGDHAYAIYKLAESYRLYSDFREAAINYKKIVVLHESEFPDARFKYANVLKEMRDYTEALTQYTIVVKKKKSCTFFECESEALQAERSADYCKAMIARDKQYGIPDSSFLKLKADRSRDLFLFSGQSNLYVTNWEPPCGLGFQQEGKNGENIIAYGIQKDSLITAFSNTGFIESYDLDGTGSFTADTLNVYFGRLDNRNDRMQTEIYMRKKVNGKWQKEKRLNDHINFDQYSSSYPEISKDGHTLYFVSDRPGGHGDKDIWYSTCEGEDNWSKPINMGSGVNTSGNETSPRIYETGRGKVMTYSSDGMKEEGGFDIYVTTEEKGWEKSVLLPFPFNSKYDDVCFVLNEKEVYLSSNRAGKFDVYMLKWQKVDKTILEIIGR